MQIIAKLVTNGHKYTDIMNEYSAFEVVCYFEECVRGELKENKDLAYAIRFGHYLKHEHWTKYVESMTLKAEKTQKREGANAFFSDLETMARAGLLSRK